MSSTLKRRKQVLLVLLPSVAAWVVAAAAPRALVYSWLPPNDAEPYLPLVSAPFNPQSDVASLVPNLFGTAMVIFVSAVFVEIGKASLLRLGRYALSVYAGLCAFQLFLAFDALRRLVPDWYGYLLHFLRLGQLSHEVRFPDPVPVPAPFASLAVLTIVCLVLAWRTWADVRDEGDEVPPDHSEEKL